jgi:hypothetical protein
MTFDRWWNLLTTREQSVIGKNNARFVWDEAVQSEREECAKLVEKAGIDGYGTLAAAAIIRKGES